MINYIIKRLLLSIFILFAVSILLYILIRLIPQNFVEQKFASQIAQGVIKQEDIDRMLKLYGLADSIPKGYMKWLSNVFHGDLGMSFNFGMPVQEIIAKDMWISFGFSFVATILQFIIAIPLGIHSATHQYGASDYAVTIFTMMGISLPTFFLASLLLSVFSKSLGWFPYQGLVSSKIFEDSFAGKVDQFFDMAWHLILPIVTLVILSIGGLMRHTRTNMLEVLNADYIRTARAKGCSEKTVIYKHAFRNTMIPVVTMLAGILPGLFSGAMITEEVFAIPGIGRKAYKATTVGDIPFIMAYNMFLSILTIIGTLLSDLAYALVDPRVKITK
ncbi:MAG: ABC transporter permease [Clostridia bacterium]|nr:ABC transporter permease [Clostridia bacterium]